MAGIGSKKLTSIYGSLLQVDNSNTGVDSTIRTIKDGAGNNTSVKISKEKAVIKPASTDSTTAFQVKNASDTALLTVDSSNNKVLAGTSQAPLGTQYAYFGVNAYHSAAWVANTHYPVPFQSGGWTSGEYDDVHFNLNTADPSNSYVIADITGFRSAQLLPFFWYVPDDIVIDEITHIQGSTGGTSSTDTTRMHLMSYTYNNNSSSVLSSGVVVGNTSSDITATHAGKMNKDVWSLDATNKSVSGGKVLICTFRSDSVNNDYSLHVVVKYRLA